MCWYTDCLSSKKLKRRKKLKKVLSILICASILIFTGIAGASVIDTATSLWDGVTSVYNMGEPTTATYGQTFRISPGQDNILQSISFYVDDYSNPGPVDFALYVYQWDGPNSTITGNALYESAPVSTTNNGGAGGWETFTFNNINTPLTPGDYVFFGSTSNFFNGVNGQSQWGALDEFVYDAYTEGTFVLFNNGGDFSLLSQPYWFAEYGFDLAFTAEFSPSGPGPEPVPEPHIMPLIGAGIFGIGVLRRKLRN
jgi:hypothetical protein